MNVDYWIEDLPCTVDWWSEFPRFTFLAPRGCVFGMQALAVALAALFAAWCWERWRGPITIEW